MNLPRAASGTARNLRLLVALVSMSSIGNATTRFAVLVSAAQAGASAVMVGVLAALFTAVAAFAAVAIGRTIDRVGTRPPLIFGATLLAIAASLGAIWRGMPMLVVIALIAGIAFNTMIIAFQRLAGELAPPDRRAEAFGMLGFGYSISLLAAPVIAGFAIDLIGFTHSFLLFALIPVGSLIMIWTDRLPMTPPVAARAAGATGTGTAPARTGTLGLLRAPLLKPLWICCLIFEAGWMGFNFMLPIVGTQLGFSASRIGIIAGVAGFTLFLTRGALTPLLQRFTPWQLLILGLALSGIGFAGLALTSDFLLMALSGSLLGIGQGACSPMVTALVYEGAPAHEKGEAMAMRTMTSNIAQSTTPLIGGTLGAAFGVGPVFGMLAVGLMAATWWCRAHWTTRRGTVQGSKPGT